MSSNTRGASDAARPHIFLFHGTDTYSIAEKVGLWKAEFEKKYGKENCIVLDCELLNNESEIYVTLNNLLRSATLFSTTKLVVLKNVFSKATKKQLLEILSRELESIPPTHFLVFKEEQTDARTVLHKTIKKMESAGRAQIQEFRIPQGDDLLSWIRKFVTSRNIPIDASALNTFVHRFDVPAQDQSWTDGVEWNLWQIVHELEKLAAYTQGRPIMKEDVALLVSENPQAHIFSLVDALASGQRQTAQRLATLLAGEGKSGVLSMTALLIGQFRSFLIIKELAGARVSDADIAKKLSWNPKRLWVVSKKIQRLTTETMRNSYRILLDIDSQLKSSSTPPLTLFDRFLRSL